MGPFHCRQIWVFMYCSVPLSMVSSTMAANLLGPRRVQPRRFSKREHEHERLSTGARARTLRLIRLSRDPPAHVRL